MEHLDETLAPRSTAIAVAPSGAAVGYRLEWDRDAPESTDPHKSMGVYKI
ncbi:hypothetical protein [Xanthobacter variabilis]